MYELHDLARDELKLNDIGITVRVININLLKELHHRTVQHMISGGKTTCEIYRDP